MNRNSSHVWLPGLEAAGLPTFRTIVIPYKHHDCMPIFDGEPSAEFDRLVNEVAFAAGEIGIPAFIRTDLGSAKHSGLKGVQIADGSIAESDGSVGWVLSRLLEDQELKFWLEREGPTAILVREWLTLKAKFTAFGGLAISNERRFFATPEKVLCQHHYWPELVGRNWMTGVVERPHLPDDSAPAGDRLRGDCATDARYDCPPPVLECAGLSPCVQILGDLFIEINKKLGLPVFESEIWQKFPASFCCWSASYSPSNKRFSLFSGSPLRADIATKESMNQIEGFGLDLRQLDHWGEGCELVSSVTGKTSVCVEDSGNIGQNGWLICHDSIIRQHISRFWFQPDGDILLRTSSPAWKQLLQAVHDEPAPDELSDLAMKAAAAAGGGAWSVDICQDVTGKYWITDMAVASDSWHWPGCPAAAYRL